MRINHWAYLWRCFWIVSSFTISTSLLAYVQNRSIYGDKVKWPHRTIAINVVTGNSSNLSKEEVVSIIKNSLGIIGDSGWQQHSNLSFTLTIDAAPAKNKNDIYFTKSGETFAGLSCEASGVIGKTETMYRQSSGEVLEADILLNDNCFFFADPSAGAMYLGNAVVHELGHLLGLGHSEVADSAMFYLLNDGQRELHSDDIAGVEEVYPGNISKGSIRGVIVGGSRLPLGVMGGQIEAFSSNNGQLIASAISDVNGNFKISGLPIDDTYYLYVRPSKYLAILPEYFQSSKKDFCQSGTNYRGSFFQSCLASEQGLPQGIRLYTGNSSIDVGKISIGCSQKVLPEYIEDKELESNEWQVYDDSTEIAGNSVVGIFTGSEINAGTGDVFTIDLSDYEVKSGEIFLDVKLIYQKLYSPLRLSILAQDSFGAVLENQNTEGYTENNYGEKNFDIIEHYRLQSGRSGLNRYTITITPDGQAYSENDFLDASNFLDDMRYYFLVFTVSEKLLTSQYKVISSKLFPTLSDNQSCLDGENTYSVLANIREKENTTTEGAKSNSSVASFVSCGTINFIDNNQGPPSVGGALIGFVMALFVRWFYGLASRRKIAG